MFTHFNHNSFMPYNTGTHVCVYLPNGSILSYVVKPSENPSNQLSDLKEYIYSITGIPANSQKLLYRNKLLVHGNLLDIGKECNVFLNLNFAGGSGECDICFGPGEFVCRECKNQITCKECCD